MSASNVNLKLDPTKVGLLPGVAAPSTGTNTGINSDSDSGSRSGSSLPTYDKFARGNAFDSASRTSSSDKSETAATSSINSAKSAISSAAKGGEQSTDAVRTTQGLETNLKTHLAEMQKLVGSVDCPDDIQDEIKSMIAQTQKQLAALQTINQKAEKELAVKEEKKAKLIDTLAVSGGVDVSSAQKKDELKSNYNTLSSLINETGSEKTWKQEKVVSDTASLLNTSDKDKNDEKQVKK